MNLEIRQQQNCGQFTLVRRKFGIFARSVRVKRVLNCYTVAVRRHLASSGIRIVLFDIEGAVRNVSQCCSLLPLPLNQSLLTARRRQLCPT